MIINRIYLLVAILTLVSAMIYIGCNEPNKGLVSRIHSIIQVIFFGCNVLSLVFIEKNLYKQEGGVLKNSNLIMVVLYCVPIIVYIIHFICHLLEEQRPSTFMTICWATYMMCCVLLISIPKCIDSKEILIERANIISYSENEVKSTFISDSIEGIDYVIVKQSSDGEVTNSIIDTRTYRDNNDIVKLYLHQEKSYIEKYKTVEENFLFFGFFYESEKEEKIYKIYLTDDMYKQK